MKFTSTFGLTALAAISTASPFAVSQLQTRQSTAAADAINQWDHDVSVVNQFLNAVGSSSTPSANAQSALMTAMDEPTQLMILINNFGPQATPNAIQASKTLLAKFGGVITSLMNIVEANDQQSVIDEQVSLINVLRCDTVLPNIKVLWAEGDFQLAGTVDVPLGPAVCPSPPAGGADFAFYPLV